MTLGDEATTRSPWSRLPLILGIAAVALLGAGLVLALRTLGAPALPPAIGTANAQPLPEPVQAPEVRVGRREEPSATLGKKPAKAFGLPSYPGAVDISSMEAGPKLGSTSFRTQNGAAVDVARFYVEALGKQGWQYQWKKKVRMTPANMKTPVVFSGSRVRWLAPKDRRQLTLLALDDPRGRGVHVSLSWIQTPGK